MTIDPTSPRRILAQRIVDAAVLHAEATAVRVNGQNVTYKQLNARANSLHEAMPADQLQRAVGVVANRTIDAYAAIFGCLRRGRTWVPIHPDHPLERTRSALESVGPIRLLATSDPRLLEVVARTKETEAGADVPAETAYVMFTSGSTGRPKGIPVSWSNLLAYTNSAFGSLDLDETALVSQIFDLTFDLSIHDLLAAWLHGATLVVASQSDRTSAGQWIEANQITHWFSVPSLAEGMRRRGELRANRFNSIRRSLFCGEALFTDLARDWAVAAPQSVVENWYGPTEATIACTRHVFGAADTDAVVPIGRPFGDTNTRLLRPDCGTDSGDVGELVLMGAQVTSGYINARERSEIQFTETVDGVTYRTGDLVRMDANGVLHYLGRTDSQVKVHGHRIELGEVEQAVRTTTMLPTVALGWPLEPPHDRLVCVVESDTVVDAAKVRAAVANLLPPSMIPSSVYRTSSLPLNVNGKIDRSAVGRWLKAEVASTPSAQAETPTTLELLLGLLTECAPELSLYQLATAPTLLHAGLDSMGFLAFTAAIEQRLGVQLTDHVVADLADADLTLIARILDRAGAGLGRPASRHHRRIRRFLSEYPRFLSQHDGQATSLLLGSSGTYRGLSAQRFADRHGWGPCVNASFTAIDAADTRRVATAISEMLVTSGNRLGNVLVELDPTMLSVSPPPSRPLAPHFFTLVGRGPSDSTHRAMDWLADQQGDADARPESVPAASPTEFQTDWLRRREAEIEDIYCGDIPMATEQIVHWAATAEALRPIARQLFGWIHPLRPGRKDTNGAYDQACREVAVTIAREHDITVLNPGSVLDRRLFRNVNHVGGIEGRVALTDLIANLSGLSGMANATPGQPLETQLLEQPS